MRVVGKWMVCDDGVQRSVVECLVTGSGTRQIDEHFLVDSCADCTVLSANLVNQLQLAGKPPPSSLSLKGISGIGEYAVCQHRGRVPPSRRWPGARPRRDG